MEKINKRLKLSIIDKNKYETLGNNFNKYVDEKKNESFLHKQT